MSDTLLTPSPDPAPDPVRTAERTSIGYVELLRVHTHLRNLWVGRAVSLMGDWFNIIALYQAVQLLSNSAAAVTLVTVAKTLPAFVISPVAGPLIDRWDRRKLLMSADIFRALCAVGVIVSYLVDSLAGLYAWTVLMMLGTGVAVPASSATLPMIIPVRHVPMANALLGGTWSISLAVGAALGGVATQLVGITAALAIDGASFLVSAFYTARLPPLPPPREHAHAAASAGMLDGLRYLLGAPYVLCLVAVRPLAALFGGVNALIPIYGNKVFVGVAGPLYVGVLFALRGVGATVGSLFLISLFGDNVATMRKLIWMSLVLALGAFVALAFSTAYWHACLSLFAVAVSQAATWVLSGSLLQIESESRYHGRIFAWEFGATTLFMSISSFGAGALLDAGARLVHVNIGFAGVVLIPLGMWSALLWRLGRRS